MKWFIAFVPQFFMYTSICFGCFSMSTLSILLTTYRRTCAMKSSSCENVRHSFPLRTMSAVAHSAMLLQM